ncbi:MAG TPA: hypothetical protein VFO98_10245 [Marmoricola sp.]|nr:hypothetical protein [Marmoricola sp.]
MPMTGSGAEPQLTSRLGTVSRVRRQDVAIMYTDVAFEVEAIQAGWPEFEAKFDSLRGRRLMAVVFPEQGIYRLATAMRDDDDPDSLGLDMGALPGGPYLLLHLEGRPQDVYRNIGPAFEELHFLGDHDASRPSIELYVGQGEVDCLLPVR